MQTPASPPSSAPRGPRLTGIDLARCLAFLGMLTVNYKVSLGASQNGPGWLVALAGAVDGRAAATFVTLAGVGLGLMAGRDSDPLRRRRARRAILARAAVLFVVGYTWVELWPGDILHNYGVYLAVGALLLGARPWALWLAAAASTLAWLALLFLVDYDAGWDASFEHYTDFWTWNGQLRNLFFNGYNPVFPWLAFLLVGMWVGRLNLAEERTRRALFVGGTSVALATELLSRTLVSRAAKIQDMQLAEDLGYLFDTASMPPMPLFVLAAGATAVATIAASLFLAERFEGSRWMRALVSTGQLALTHYAGHVFIGLGLLAACGYLEGEESLAFALLASALYGAFAIASSAWIRGRFQRGPLEWLLRRASRS